jgi:hypothetical protein
VIAVVLVIASVAIWISSRILSIEGGFWRSVVAATIAGVLSAIGSAVLGSHPSFLVSCVLGFVTGTIAIKLCMEASVGNALVCSVLSSIMTAILVFVAIIAVGVKMRLTKARALQRGCRARYVGMSALLSAMFVLATSCVVGLARFRLREGAKRPHAAADYFASRATVVRQDPESEFLQLLAVAVASIRTKR